MTICYVMDKARTHVGYLANFLGGKEGEGWIEGFFTLK
jgi:hypothetical protein